MTVLLRPLLVLLTIVAIVVVLLVALFGGGGDGGERGGDADEPAQASRGTVTANELEVGDCISDANSTQGDATTFDAADCDAPHDGEVFTQIVLAGAEGAKFPGTELVNGKGQRGCRSRLRRQATANAFKDRQLGFKFVYPTIASWAEGDREITCLATFREPRSERLAQR